MRKLALAAILLLTSLGIPKETVQSETFDWEKELKKRFSEGMSYDDVIIEPGHAARRIEQGSLVPSHDDWYHPMNTEYSGPDFVGPICFQPVSSVRKRMMTWATIPRTLHLPVTQVNWTWFKFRYSDASRSYGPKRQPGLDGVHQVNQLSVEKGN